MDNKPVGKCFHCGYPGASFVANSRGPVCDVCLSMLESMAQSVQSMYYWAGLQSEWELEQAKRKQILSQ